MAGEERLLSLLRLLTEREQWDTRQLPAPITVDVLRVFDSHYWIELQTTELENGRESLVSRWFSPIRSPRIAGSWDIIQNNYFGPDPRWANRRCYVRLSDWGRAELDEATLARTADKSASIESRGDLAVSGARKGSHATRPGDGDAGPSVPFVGRVQPEAASPRTLYMADLNDPILVADVVRAVGHKAGRSDKLAEKMKRHNYRVVKSANKWWCQRGDAMVLFPHQRQRIEDIGATARGAAVEGR